MSYDPIESASKGAVKGFTEGVLEWGSDLIKGMATKLRDGKLAFIQDQKTIQIVKEQYRSGELAIYKEYVKDRDMIFLLKMGLTLRMLDKEKEESRRQKLRGKLLERYKVKGLHIAQFVQNGLLNRYIGILIENISSAEEFKKDLMNILENIEKHVLFVRNDDLERNVIQSSISIVSVHSPTIFIVSGIFSAAEIVRKCEIKLVELLNDYELEKISSGYKENLFFKRILKI